MLKDENLSHHSLTFSQLTVHLSRPHPKSSEPYIGEWTKYVGKWAEEHRAIALEYKKALSEARSERREAIKLFNEEAGHLSAALIAFATEHEQYLKLENLQARLSAGIPVPEMKIADKFVEDYLHIRGFPEDAVSSARGVSEFSKMLSAPIKRECAELRQSLIASARAIAGSVTEFQSFALLENLMAVEKGEPGRARFVRVINRFSELASYLKTYGADGTKTWINGFVERLRKCDRAVSLFLEAEQDERIPFSDSVRRSAKREFVEPASPSGERFDPRKDLTGRIYLLIARHLDAQSTIHAEHEETQENSPQIETPFEVIAANERRQMIRQLISEYPVTAVVGEIRRQLYEPHFSEKYPEECEKLLKHVTEIHDELEVDILSLAINFNVDEAAATSIAKARFVNGDLTSLADILNDYSAQADSFSKAVMRHPQLLELSEISLREYFTALGVIQSTASELSPLVDEFVLEYPGRFEDVGTVQRFSEELISAKGDPRAIKKLEREALTELIRNSIQELLRDPTSVDLARIATEVLIYGFAPAPGEVYNPTETRDFQHIIRGIRRDTNRELSNKILSEIIEDLVNARFIVCSDRTQARQLNRGKYKLSMNIVGGVRPLVERLNGYFERNYRGQPEPEIANAVIVAAPAESSRVTESVGDAQRMQASHTQSALSRMKAVIEASMRKYKQLLIDVHGDFAERFEQLEEYRQSKERETGLIQRLKRVVGLPAVQLFNESRKFASPIDRVCFDAVTRGSIHSSVSTPRYFEGGKGGSKTRTSTPKLNIERIVGDQLLNFRSGFSRALGNFKELQRADAAFRKLVDDPLVRENIPELVEFAKTLPGGIANDSREEQSLERLSNFLRPLLRTNGSDPISMLRERFETLELKMSGGGAVV